MMTDKEKENKTGLLATISVALSSLGDSMLGMYLGLALIFAAIGIGSALKKWDGHLYDQENKKTPNI
jgi:hypothetical protein